MKIDTELISNAMNHLTDIHDELLATKKRHGTFMTDNYIKMLDKTIDNLAYLKRNADHASKYLQKKV